MNHLMATTEQRLIDAENALHALITGELIVSVTVSGGRTNQYTPANASELRKYIAGLKRELGTGGYLGPIEFFG